MRLTNPFMAFSAMLFTMGAILAVYPLMQQWQILLPLTVLLGMCTGGFYIGMSSSVLLYKHSRCSTNYFHM